MASLLKNHFLIAMPSLNDTFFHHSVIYLCEHDEQGAMGVIINRPTQIMLDELLSHINITNNNEQNKTTSVLFGGPIQKNHSVVLHDSMGHWNTSKPVSDTISLTTSFDILETLATGSGPKHTLVALGYAGWGPSQLEQELIDNSWLTVPANSKILFNTPTKQRWHAASALLGVDINLLSSTTGHA